ncbi:MAG: hypothetical protein ACRDRN_19590 [Sciscionella sp.]
MTCLGLVALPAIHGPHLWLGLPSLLWWTVIFGVLLISAVLGVFEIVREGNEAGDEE